LNFTFEEVASEVDFPGHPQHGLRKAHVVLGDLDDPAATHVMWIQLPPGLTGPAHAHPSDYCEVILEGTLRVGKKSHQVGDVRVVKADTGYGPLEAGPEGCTMIAIFENDYSAILKGAPSANRTPLPPDQAAALDRPVNS
jgi:hypothetical protein